MGNIAEHPRLETLTLSIFSIAQKGPESIRRIKQAQSVSQHYSWGMAIRKSTSGPSCELGPIHSLNAPGSTMYS